MNIEQAFRIMDEVLSHIDEQGEATIRKGGDLEEALAKCLDAIAEAGGY